MINSKTVKQKMLHFIWGQPSWYRQWPVTLIVCWQFSICPREFVLADIVPAMRTLLCPAVTQDSKDRWSQPRLREMRVYKQMWHRKTLCLSSKEYFIQQPTVNITLHKTYQVPTDEWRVCFLKSFFFLNLI